MDPHAVRDAFDEQVRRRPDGADSPDGSVQTEANVVRCLPTDAGWTGVTWSDLRPDGADADAVIADQIRRFADQPHPWEWKHYSYDQPADLAERLLAAGFTAEPAETLLIAEIADLDLEVRPPAGVHLVDVVDEEGVKALISVHEETFGGDYSDVGRIVLAGLGRRPATTAAVLAMAGDQPICAGRLEFHPGTEFAGLWGGGTLPAWRRRGVFRALVAHRAALAASLGFRYLQVDATDDSRPILRRLGFVELATTTPFIRPSAILALPTVSCCAPAPPR